MDILIGIAALFAVLILIGVIFGIIEQRKIHRSGRQREKPPASRTHGHIVISQRIPTVSEALRGGPRPDLDGRSRNQHSRGSHSSHRH